MRSSTCRRSSLATWVEGRSGLRLIEKQRLKAVGCIEGTRVCVSGTESKRGFSCANLWGVNLHRPDLGLHARDFNAEVVHIAEAVAD
jgi:hypothetical protein